MTITFPVLANYVDPAYIAVAILFLAIVLFLTEKISSALTCIIASVLFVITGVANFSTAFSGLTNTTVIMVFGILIVGEAMMSSGLAKLIGLWCIRFSKGNVRLFIFWGMLAIGLLSMWMDNTTMLAVFLSIILGAKAAQKEWRILDMVLPICLSSMLGGGATLVGCTVNLTGQAVLEGLTGMSFTMFDFSKVGIPLWLITVAYCNTVGFRLGQKIWGDRPDDGLMEGGSELAEMDTNKILLTCFVLLLMLFCFVTQIFTVGITALICAILCVLFKLVDFKVMMKKLPWELLLRLAGMMSIAACLNGSGFNKLVADAFIKAFGDNINPYLLFSVAVFISLMLSQVMGNSATVTVILTPLIPVVMGMGYSPLPFSMGVIYAASSAFMTPIAGSCIGLSLSGGYEFRDYIKYTGPLTLLIYISILLMVPLFFPF